jgi:Fic family protein
MHFVDEVFASGTPFRLRPSLLTTLNRYATEDVYPFAGVPRTFRVFIENSAHQPPDFQKVPELLEEMCDYVNENWNRTPIHLAAYLLWRVNWIHPFGDGNGRTARMISYIVLCIRLGFKLPGIRTIPEQIAVDKTPYYVALEAADASLASPHIDLSVMENMLSKMLAAQLVQLHNDATGTV